MFQGTGSSVGKSLLVAGLARALHRRGLRVRPFKPQNMSNNAAVTADGGEIGRAQALQARAAGVPPSVHMNPVLLKPQSEIGSQVVVQGRVVGTARARDYQAMKPGLLPHVLDSFARMRAEADIVLVEGAGSASEVNLRAGDIANMGFARAADVPVVVIGDIDRGGVIASLVGTHAVLDPADRAMVAGFVVNRMRGDASLFDAGMRPIADRTGWPALGPGAVLPRRAPLAGGGRGRPRLRPRPGAAVRIAVPVLPWISNFDDLDPLAAEPGVDLCWCAPGARCRCATWWCCPGPRPRSPTWRRCAPRAGTSTCARTTAAAAASWGCAAATRCWAAASPTPTGSRARRAACRGWGCCRSTPCWAATSGWSR